MVALQFVATVLSPLFFYTIFFRDGVTRVEEEGEEEEDTEEWEAEDDESRGFWVSS